MTLTPRQAQVARLIADGRTNRNIATTLGLSAESVKSYVALIAAKVAPDAAIPARRAIIRWVLQEER